jgi:1-acyl-sn-glycerol-3-phosphate acyltransferase
MIWKCRVFGRRHEPPSGGVVLLCNHQSFFDPMLASFSLRRPCHFMARDTLFKLPGFSHLISSLHTFPIRRGQADIGALKEAMRRLKAGAVILLFPEGARTADERIGTFLPGAAVLSRRAAEWTVPVVIDGAATAWPKFAAFPTLGEGVVVEYGTPIHRDEANRYSPEQFMARVRREMIDMQRALRERLRKPPLTYDKIMTRDKTRRPIKNK